MDFNLHQTNIYYSIYETRAIFNENYNNYTVCLVCRLYEAALPQDGPHQQHISGGQTTGQRSGIKTNVRTRMLF